MILCSFGARQASTSYVVNHLLEHAWAQPYEYVKKDTIRRRPIFSCHADDQVSPTKRHKDSPNVIKTVPF